MHFSCQNKNKKDILNFRLAPLCSVIYTNRFRKKCIDAESIPQPLMSMEGKRILHKTCCHDFAGIICLYNEE